MKTGFHSYGYRLLFVAIIVIVRIAIAPAIIILMPQKVGQVYFFRCISTQLYPIAFSIIILLLILQVILIIIFIRLITVLKSRIFHRYFFYPFLKISNWYLL